MNNDTPQVFGEDTHDYRHDAYPHDPGPPPDQDGEDFPPFRGWAGWGERVEPVGPDDEYPQPSFSLSPRTYEPALLTSRSIRTGPVPGSRVTRRVPATPLDPGYARDLGYPHDPEAGAVTCQPAAISGPRLRHGPGLRGRPWLRGGRGLRPGRRTRAGDGAAARSGRPGRHAGAGAAPAARRGGDTPPQPVGRRPWHVLPGAVADRTCRCRRGSGRPGRMATARSGTRFSRRRPSWNRSTSGRPRTA